MLTFRRRRSIARRRALVGRRPPKRRHTWSVTAMPPFASVRNILMPNALIVPVQRVPPGEDPRRMRGAALVMDPNDGRTIIDAALTRPPDPRPLRLPINPNHPRARRPTARSARTHRLLAPQVPRLPTCKRDRRLDLVFARVLRVVHRKFGLRGTIRCVGALRKSVAPISRTLAHDPRLPAVISATPPLRFAIETKDEAGCTLSSSARSMRPKGMS